MSTTLQRLASSMLSKARTFSPLPILPRVGASGLNLNSTHARNSLTSPVWKPSRPKQYAHSRPHASNHFEPGIHSPFPVYSKQRPILFEEKASQISEPNHFPRILIVSRRHLRKGKYVDFVGEYHIDLIQESGGVPILIPRTMKTTEQLEAYLFGGVDGVLVMEGNDLGQEYHPYGEDLQLSPDVLSQVASVHTGDVEIDNAKDCIEMQLIIEKVLKEGVPYLGLCRGSQLLNVAMGGTLYCDVTAEVGDSVKHIDYDNYDGHRHNISVLPQTPLSGWFHEQFPRKDKPATLVVNSYHHQGIKTLAPGLKPMCFSEDGLVEGYFHSQHFDPANGKYHIGLQWHPERMLDDYLGCKRVYQDFVRAAQVHRANALRSIPVTRHLGPVASSWLSM